MNNAVYRIPRSSRPSRVSEFTNRQRKRIAIWLERGLSLENIARRCQTHFQQKISLSQLSRFSQRLDLAALRNRPAEKVTGDTETLTETLAALGATNFVDGALKALEQRFFEISLRRTTPEELRELEHLHDILLSHRNSAAKERRAALQQHKCQLRREELQHKADVLELEAALHGISRESSPPANPPMLPLEKPLNGAIFEQS